MKRAIVFIGTMVAAISIMAQGKITVVIEEVESNEGNVFVNLYKSNDGFPNEWDKVFRQEKLEAKEGSMTCTFNNIPWGTYAVSIAHDQDGDGELDKNFVGLPKEPVGASNQSGFGKPNFNRSKFELSLTSSPKKLNVKFLN